jgi:fumarylacetoacetate (FAA) hydrolase
MRLATSEDGSRDGQLMVVASDLAIVHPATSHASRLQQVLDDWNFLSPQLQDLATTLEQGKARHALPWQAVVWQAPLPRAFRCLVVGDGAQAQEADRTLSDGGKAPRPRLRDIAPVWQGPRLAANPRGATDAPSPCWQLVPALAFVTGDLAAGAEPGAARDAVRLVGMALHLATVGDVEAVPAHRGDAGCSGRWVFAPVVVTPDELGASWRDGRIDGTWTLAAGDAARAPRSSPTVSSAAAPIGLPVDMGLLIAEAAGPAALQAGTIVLVPQPPGEAWLWRENEALQLGARSADGRDLFGSIRAVGADAPAARSTSATLPTTPVA